MIHSLHTHDRLIFFLALTGVLTGIFLTNIFSSSSIFILLFLCIISVHFSFFYRSTFIYILIYTMSFFLGSYISLDKLHEIERITHIFQEESIFFTQPVFIQGTLKEKVSENTTSTRYIVRNLIIGTQQFPDHIGILIAFPESRWKAINDMISFTGVLSLPIKRDMFDYQKYLLIDNVYALTQATFPDKIGNRPSSFILNFVRDIRTRIFSLIRDIYPRESAQLLEWILIWERADLSQETKTQFNRSGLTHIIAVSGFNITIIIIFLSFIFRSFPVWIRLFSVCSCIVFFTLLVGFQISVLRASVFGLIGYIVLLAWSRVRSFSLLCFIATVFTVINPLILNYDVSFHLSFLAVFWLLFFGNFFNRIFWWLPSWFGFREALTMCLAAMVFTLPILLVNFWQVSLISPIANIAIVPFIPMVMLGGFFSIVVALFSTQMGIIAWFPTWLWLSYILDTVAWFGNLSYASIVVDLGIYTYIFEIGYLLIIIFLIVYFQEESEDIVERDCLNTTNVST